jgi:hypothetical protein
MTKVILKAAMVVILFTGLGSKLNAAENTVDKTLFEIISESKNCENIISGKECDYSVGNFFKVSIAAIGTDIAAIYFFKSDAEQPVYGSFGTHHGCVIINRWKGSKGLPEYVFISPKNGNVYNSWQECGKAS